MVDRCVSADLVPCTVVDLDGTYIKGNTLKIFLKCGLRFLIRHNNYRDFRRLVFVVGKRQLRLSTHTEMRDDVIRILRPYYGGISEEFSRCVKHCINPKVKSLLEDRKTKGHRILLATAASGFYIPSIWEGDFVAECRGSEKPERVMQWLIDNNCKLDTVITDHREDIPLLLANEKGKNILVNPSSSTLASLRSLGNISIMT